MPDRFVTVASYAWTPEAQIAKNLLESEGIPAFVAGEQVANVFSGVVGEAQLQVREEDAPRAVSLLAAAAARVSLDANWEAQAERGVKPCTVCGMAYAIGEGVCPACGTADERITADRRGTWAPGAGKPASEGVKTGDQVQGEAPRTVLRGADKEARGGSGCAVLVVAMLAVGLGLLFV